MTHYFSGKICPRCPSAIGALVVCVALFSVGCGEAGDQQTGSSSSSDSTLVLRSDSTLRATADSVSEAGVLPADSVATAIDTGPTAVADSAGLTALFKEIASLRSEVAKLGAAAGSAQTAAQPKATTDTLRANARERVKETAQDVQNFGLRAFWAVIIVTAAFFLIKFIVWILETLSERSARRRLFFKKLIPVTRILVWIVVVYYIVSGVFEVDRDGLLAAGAAVGVAVGFAAQDVLKNIFGGILIILDQPFQVGDRVSVGGTYGEVVSIGLRSTRIVTPDDNLVSVPNTQVVDGQVANANAGALDCQVVTQLYLPGWVDVARAKEIAYDAAANSKFVYLKKPIVVLVQDEFKETFLTRIVIKAYVLDARYEARFASDVTETAKIQYLREGMLAEFYPGMSVAAELDGSAELTGGAA